MLDRNSLLKEMKESIGTKDPIEYFNKMTDLFKSMSDQLDQLQKDVSRIKIHSALAVKWEPRIASDLLVEQINVLRKDADVYANEITAFKKAFTEDLVTQNYNDFVNFWMDNSGYHPFLNYE